MGSSLSYGAVGSCLCNGDDGTENSDSGPAVPAIYAMFSVTQSTSGKF